MKRISKRRKGRTILSSILVTMIVVLVIQTSLFIIAIFLGGAFKNLDNSAFEMFQEITQYRKNYLEKEMVNRWMNIESQYKEIITITDETIESEQSSYEIFLSGETNINTSIINNTTDTLIKTINSNAVTGAFVIFGTDENVNKYGTYLRDTNYNSIVDSNSDIKVEVAPLGFSHPYSMIESTYVSRQFLYKSYTDQQKRIFLTPTTTLKNSPQLSYKNCGWWSTPFVLNDPTYPVMTYSVPLINSDGLIYGVFGVEVSVEYLNTLMPANELDSDYNGFYFLARKEKGELSERHTVVSAYDSTPTRNSPQITEILNITSNNYKKTSYEDIFQASTKDNSFYLTFHSFKIYDNNTPFSHDEWVLVGVLPSSLIHQFSNRLQLSVFISILLSVIFSTTIIITLTYYITNPITKLTHQVKQTKFLEELSLSKTNILEIDELTSAIESLNETVIESEVKLGKIIDLVNLPIIAFEYNYDLNTVYTSRNVNEFLMFDEIVRETIEDYMNLFASLEQFRIKGEETIYKYVDLNNQQRWIEVRYIENEYGITKTGILIDVSQEYFEKEHLLYERNVDSLTSLLNRRAFLDEIDEIFKTPEVIKYGAIIMLDIDDLKFVNDTYGHDYGDVYIKSTADIITEGVVNIKNKICGRRSGDEFFIFLYGYTDVDDIEDDIHHLKSTFKSSISFAPDGTSHFIRASAGIALYPTDGTTYQDLIKYADYAMYEIKNSLKGEFKYFDHKSYEQNAYLLHNKEELNTLIENELVDFYFQAIVDIKKGTILGYEGLMRSLLPSFKGPIEILNVAKSQFKLNKIERLTFMKLLEKYTNNANAFKNRKLFINSIANQRISDEDVSYLEERYGMFLSNVVLEFTEHEKSVKAITEQKCNLMNRWNGEIALDDYGTGFNSEVILLESEPNYVKIDISLVRNIHTDLDRQQMVNNIIAYTKKKGIKTIAEGVEVVEELETLINLGCDYVQGYFLAKPSPLPIELPDHLVAIIHELNEKKNNTK